MDLCIHLPSYLLTLPSIHSSTHHLYAHLSICIWPTDSFWTTQSSIAPITTPAVLTYLSSWALFIFDVSKFTLLLLLNGILEI